MKQKYIFKIILSVQLVFYFQSSNIEAQNIQLGIPAGHANAIYGIQYSPDGKLILTSSGDYTAKVWHAQSGKLLYSLEGHDEGVNAKFSPDGMHVISCGGEVNVWETISGKLEYSIDGNFEFWKCTNDNKYFVLTNAEQDILLVEILNGNIFKKLTTGYLKPINHLDITLDNKYIAVAAEYDSIVNIWDVNNDTIISRLCGHKGEINSIKFSPSGNRILTNSYILCHEDSDSSAVLWDFIEGKPLFKTKSHYCNSLRGLSTFSPDSRYFTTALYADSWNSTINLWQYKGTKLLYSFDCEQKISDVKFSPDSRFLALAGHGIAYIYDLSNGKLLSILRDTTNVCRWYASADFSPDGNRFVLAGCKSATQYNIHDWIIINRVRGFPNLVKSSSFNSNGNSLLIEDYFYGKKILDFTTGEVLSDYEGSDTNWFQLSDQSPNGEQFLNQIPNEDGKGHNVYLFKGWIEDGKTIISIKRNILIEDTSFSAVSSESFSYDNDYVSLALWDGRAVVFDINKEEFMYFVGHSSVVLTSNISNDGKFLFTSSNDGTCKVWDIVSKKELLTLILIDSSDYVVVTQTGYFDATPRALELMYYVQGIEIIPLEAYYEQFYRPNLWKRVMNGEEIEKSSIEFEKQSPLPLLEITEPKLNIRGVGTLAVPESLMKVSVKLTDCGGGINEIRLLHNGKLVEIKKVNINQKDDTITKTFYLDLLSGINEIKISAFNFERTAKSESFKVAYTDKIQQVSNLYILAIGINEYKKNSYQLNYAVNDAEAFVEGIEKGAKDIFGKVELIRLYDQKASKQSITTAFDSIKTKARPNDVFIFYYAGHGSMSIEEKNKKPVFYLLPYEVTDMFNPETLEKTAISANSIMEFSRDIKAQKQLFILDACQSGGAVDMLANRGAIEERAIALLAKSTGTYFLTASGSEQFASEVSSLGHGIFTYAVLAGLAGGADAANDNNVTVEELLPFVKKTVPELSKQHKGSEQFPVSYGFGQDFPVVVSGMVEIPNELPEPVGKYDALSIQELKELKMEAIENEDYLKANEIKIEIESRNE